MQVEYNRFIIKEIIGHFILSSLNERILFHLKLRNISILDLYLQYSSIIILKGSALNSINWPIIFVILNVRIQDCLHFTEIGINYNVAIKII